MTTGEMIERLREALQAGKLDKFHLPFSRTILRKNRRPNWRPSPRQDRRLRLIVSQLIAAETP